MDVEFRPLSRAIGAEVVGVDLSKPVDEDLFERLRRGLLEWIVLLFREQHAMSPADQVRFCRRFDRLDVHKLPEYTLPGYPEIFCVSNMTKDGRPIGAIKVGQHWHSDYFHLRKPASFTLLRAIEVPPEKGETVFANMYAAYESLPASMKRRVAGLKARHSRGPLHEKFFSAAPREKLAEIAREEPDVTHPVIRTHPEVGRKALYLGGEISSEIEGLPADEAKALYADLLAFATQPRFTYTHHWQAGDALLSDNRCSLHRAMPFDEETYGRLLHRTTMMGEDVPH